MARKLDWEKARRNEVYGPFSAGEELGRADELEHESWVQAKRAAWKKAVKAYLKAKKAARSQN